MARHRNLKYADRQLIQELCQTNMSVEEIANKVGFHKNSIYSELQRGGGGNGKRWLYNADVAQKSEYRKCVI